MAAKKKAKGAKGRGSKAKANQRAAVASARLSNPGVRSPFGKKGAKANVAGKTVRIPGSRAKKGGVAGKAAG